MAREKKNAANYKAARENKIRGKTEGKEKMVGRVGFEPTVSFRRRIMSPLPATNTASGPAKPEKKRPGA